MAGFDAGRDVDACARRAPDADPAARVLRIPLAVAVIACGLTAFQAAAQAPDRTLAERLTPEVLAVIFPGAEQIGAEGGAPPAAEVYIGGTLVGYVYSTIDVVAAPGYSSVPFDVVAGVDLSSTITGAKVLYHNEPYVLNDDIRQPLLDRFLSSQAGHKLHGSNIVALAPDFVSGATVTARAMRDAILDSARMTYGARVEHKTIRAPTVDRHGFRPRGFADLLAQGSVVRRVFSNAEIRSMFVSTFGPDAKPNVPLGAPNDVFVDLYLALATPPAISRNLLGQDFSKLMKRMPENGQAIILASDGPFDFLGDSYVGQPDNYSFIHLRVVQDERVFRFDRAHHLRVPRRGTEGVGSRRIAAVFYFDADSGFDALEPWRLELYIDGTAPGGLAGVRVPLDYHLPARHILVPGQAPVPAWVDAWQDQVVELGVLGVGLIVLTLALVFHAPMTRRRRLHRWLRNGFLLFVVVWLGGIAGAQLSIVNVVNYMLAPFRNFGWGFYLAEPMIIVIAVYTAASLVLLGRGVFCGWLCPFGALQELLAQAARAIGLPQWNPSDALQKRLWMVKYVAAAIVLGLAFVSVDMATTAAEIEPFKTAITAKFVRAWPFVVYAAALLVIGLFTERAYCRFLCPLGAVLAVLGRVHLFNNLKRRTECGTPCQLCTHACPVKVIARTGEIDMNECFQCLDCQVEYYDDKRCPPLVWERKRRAREAPSATAPVAARSRA